MQTDEQVLAKFDNGMAALRESSEGHENDERAADGVIMVARLFLEVLLDIRNAVVRQ
jgi:hypothetical protein